MKHLSIVKKEVIGVVLLLLISSTLSVPQAHAQETALEIGADALGCVVSGEIEGLIDSGIGAVEEFFSGDDSGLEANIPGGESENVPVNVEKDKPRKERETRDCISAGVKRELINTAMLDILDFVRAEDKTRFIEDYGETIKEAGSGAAANIVKDITGVNICEPFRAQLEIVVDRTLSPRSYRDRFDCTIEGAIETQTAAIEAFQDDFRNGGWDMWRVVRRQNSPLGAYLEASDARILAIAEAERAAETQAVASRGFDDVAKCFEEQIITDSGPESPQSIPEGRDLADWQESARERENSDPAVRDVVCTDKRTVTPGSVVAGQTDEAVGLERKNLEEADSFYEIIKEVMTVAVSDILKNGL